MRVAGNVFRTRFLLILCTGRGLACNCCAVCRWDVHVPGTLPE